MPSSRSSPSTEIPSGATSTSAQSESEIGFGRCGERVANVPRGLIVQERVDRVGPADGLVQVRDHPDVREAVEVDEAAAMRLGEHDPRRARTSSAAGCSGIPSSEAWAELTMPDRLVVDRALRRARRAAPRRRRAPPARSISRQIGDGAVEALGLGDPLRESALAALEDRRAGPAAAVPVAARAVEKEELEQQLRAEVADVLDGPSPASAGAPRGRAASARAERAPGPLALGALPRSST